jgi:hypothetical protein
VNGAHAMRAQLRAMQETVAAADAAADAARDDRDKVIIRLAAEHELTYQELAAITGLSVAAIGKIVKAGGVRRYRER